MSFNSVIPLCNLARTDWSSESAKRDITLTACDWFISVCISKCEISDASQVDSALEVSWNGLDDEPAAALA